MHKDLALQQFFRVKVGLLCPLLPELRIVDVDVVPVRRQAEAGLGERRALDAGLDLHHLSAPLKDVLDVLLAEVGSGAVILHQSSIRALLKQVLDFFLA